MRWRARLARKRGWLESAAGGKARLAGKRGWRESATGGKARYLRDGSGQESCLALAVELRREMGEALLLDLQPSRLVWDLLDESAQQYK